MIFKNNEKRQQKELQEDVEKFNPELYALLGKYKLGIKPTLKFTLDGIVPALTFFRVEPEVKE